MTKRYERTAEGPAANPLNKTGEIVTGIDATTEVPPGSPQFATFEEAAKKASDDAVRAQADAIATGAMETRDHRGADDVDAKGKTKARIAIHEIDGLADEMAARFANGVERVTSRADGDTLSVTIITKHGVSQADAKVDDWSKAGVNKALKEIEEKMNGKSTASEEPKDKLADAIRELAKA